MNNGFDWVIDEDDYDNEEQKEEFEDDGDEYYLEGMSLDDKIAQLQKNANVILDQDEKGYKGLKEDMTYKM